MNHVYRNPVLQRLQAEANGQPLSGLNKIDYEAGQTWVGGTGSQPQMWFPERGVLTLEQQAQSTHVGVALLGCTFGIPFPGQDDARLRALTDGQAHVLPAATVMTLSPDLFLRSQQLLMQQIARWAYCMRHHGWRQRLADRLLWAHLIAPADALHWSIQDLPGHPPVLIEQPELALQSLLDLGAVSLDGVQLSLQNPGALRSVACGCHSNLAVSDGRAQPVYRFGALKNDGS